MSPTPTLTIDQAKALWDQAATQIRWRRWKDFLEPSEKGAKVFDTFVPLP